MVKTTIYKYQMKKHIKKTDNKKTPFKLKGVLF